jgi:CubicO group peptidase (beta-lactamase class C family)
MEYGPWQLGLKFFVSLNLKLNDMYSPSKIWQFLLSLIFLFLLASEHNLGFARTLPEDFSALDTYIQAQLDLAGIPGAALVVVSKDQILHMRGFGISGPDQSLTTPQTLFLLGSTSKSFTALAIMQLVEAGKLELDAPLTRYLPWFQVDTAEATQAITVRHLLNQTSGFSTLEGMSDFANTDSSAEAFEKRIRALKSVKLSAVVGTKFEYSNINYVLLGYLIEVISGVSYSQYIEHQVFAPLAMHSSAASDTLSKTSQIANGYQYWFGKVVAAPDLPYPKILAPAGYLYSNAEDMGHYLMAHIADGIFDGRAVLSSEGVATLHQSSVPFGSRLRYAMGWIVDPQDPGFYDHDGGLPHFASYMAIAPDEAWAVALLVNGNNFIAGPNIPMLGPQIARILKGEPGLPIQTGRIFPFELFGLVMALLLQAIIASYYILRVRRWRLYPERAPKRRSNCLLKAFLPLIAGLLPFTLVFILLPLVRNFYLPDLFMFAPDAGVLILLNLYLGLLGGVLCAVAVLLEYRRLILLNLGVLRSAKK